MFEKSKLLDELNADIVEIPMTELRVLKKNLKEFSQCDFKSFNIVKLFIL